MSEQIGEIVFFNRQLNRLRYLPPLPLGEVMASA